MSWGQSTFGSFVGTVKDPAGAVVPECVVTLINKGTAAKRSGVTNADGSYTFVNIEPGMYDITFQATGFQPATITGFELLARQTMRADSTLKLASVSESVNVTAAMEPTINTEVSNVAETKVGRELIDLPVAIGSRASGSTSPISTLTTQPGVQADNNGNISVVGAKPAMISVTLDGISTASAKTNTPITEMFPSFEGIAEIRVSEINNTAEFGGVSDITTISKGGSNAYHGSLFENWQGSALNAKNPFATTKPKLVMNNFGASFGGPLVLPKLYDGHNKTFFFMDYEGLRLPNSETVIRSIPTPAMINGNLSVYTQPIKDAFGGGTPFVGNIIPLTRITELSRKAAALYWPDAPNYGAPGAIANNYSANFPASVTTNQGDIRVDQNISANQTAFGRLTYKKRAQQNPPSGPIVLGGGSTDETYYNLTGAHNTIITPTLVNEVRFGISKQDQSTLYGYSSQGVASALGLTLPSLPKGAASTNFNINGFSATSGGTDSISASRTVQFLDNVTWSKGRHSFKFGGDYRHLSGLYTNVFASGRMSSYTFNNAAVSAAFGAPFAAFLLGAPDQSGLTTVKNPDSFGFASHYAFYVQDNWKVTSRLTFNYGLRYEYHPNYEDHYLNVANFLPDYVSTVNGQTVKGAVVIPNGQKAQDNLNADFVASIAPTPVLTAAQAGLPQSLRYSQKTDFGPRFGFAWRATKDGKLVIRGGIGRYIEGLSGSGLNAAWAVSSSFVGTYSNSLVNGRPRYSFPSPFPPSLALPGTEAFRLASETNYKDPKVDQWNLTIERDLGFNTGLRVTYDGSHGKNLGVTYNANQLRPNTIGLPGSAANAPFPYFNAIQTYGSGARSNYNALTIAVTRRFSKGLQFQGSYAFSKNLSNGNGAAPTGFSGESGGTVTDRFNYGLDYGNVAFTRRHRFQTTFLYAPQFNVGNSIARYVVNGWELSGVVMAQSGAFLTVTTSGADPAGIGANGAYVGGTVRADVVPGVSVIPGNQNPSTWINSAAFARPANNIGRFGNSSIGSVLGPGTQSVSLSVFRSVKFKDQVQMRVGMAVANALNHANFGNPATQIGVPAFGTITTMQSAEGAGPRSMQLTGRITF
ncbi:MAG: carboxypeptidase regulatory-like domain-containing protein [Acidobacteriota bacterium]